VGPLDCFWKVGCLSYLLLPHTLRLMTCQGHDMEAHCCLWVATQGVVVHLAAAVAAAEVLWAREPAADVLACWWTQA
jgi:hypothetical protein